MHTRLILLWTTAAVAVVGCAPPPPGNEVVVPLGSADGFAILAKSGVSTVPASAITGDIGVSPAAGTFLTVRRRQPGVLNVAPGDRQGLRC
jgi:hypothetical protein